MSNRVTTGRPLGVDRADQPCDNHATDRTAQWFAAIIKEAPDAYQSSAPVPHGACRDVPSGATPLPAEGTTPRAGISPLSGRAFAATPVPALTAAFGPGRYAAEGRERSRRAPCAPRMRQGGAMRRGTRRLATRGPPPRGL
jgi:hypothetical protein